MQTPNTLTLEDQRFEQILGLEGIPLQQFYHEEAYTGLFPDAVNYPDFFNQNLVSEERVLKQFKNNPHSNIRIFYLQILRLSYQIRPEIGDNKQFITNFKRVVFHPQFEILFTQETEDQRELHNDFQFKRFFAQFIVLLDRQQNVLIEDVISHFPIMDTVFIHILRSVLSTLGIDQQFTIKIPTEIVFQQLCNLLGLGITSYGNCWKFQDSDMFCYQENEDEMYLAYIMDDDEDDDENEENDQIAHLNPNIVQQQSIQIEEVIHPDAIKADSKIMTNQEQLNTSNSSKNQSKEQNPKIQQLHHSRKQHSHFQQQQKYISPQNKLNYTPNMHPQVPLNNHPYQSSYGPQYAGQTRSKQGSSISKHQTSIIREKYQYTQYPGIITTQRHKVAKQNKGSPFHSSFSESRGKESYSRVLQKVDERFDQDTSKKEIRYNMQNQVKQRLNEHNFEDFQPVYQSSYKSNFRPQHQSTYSHPNKKGQKSDISHYYPQSIKSTGYKTNHQNITNFQPAQMTPLPFMKYRKAESSIGYAPNPQKTNSHPFNSIQMGTQQRSRNKMYAKPWEDIYQYEYPVRPVTKFKPVSPTPMPDFSKYNYSSRKDPNSYQRYRNQRYGDQQYSQGFKTDRSADWCQTRTPSRRASQINTQRHVYKLNIQTNYQYYADFTPPQILQKLRPQNRQKISIIKQSMKGIVKGQQIPPGLGIRKSAIYDNQQSLFSKQQLYRNQSRSQFQYLQSHKKPFTSKFGTYQEMRQMKRMDVFGLV